MRKSLVILLAVIFGFCVSCRMTEAEMPAQSQEDIFLTMEETPDVKTALDPSTLSVSWENGDKLCVWAKGTATSATLTARSAGTTVLFAGEKGELDTSCDLYAIYPASAVKMQTSGHTGITIQNKATQTGLLSDFSEYNVNYTTCLTKQVNSDGTLQLSYSGRPSNLFAVVKLTIKSGLDVKEIRISGYDADGNSTAVCGNVGFKPSRPGIFSVGTSNEITVSRDDEVINGDVYVFISPNSPTAKTEGISDAPILSETNPAVNTAAKLTFTFTNSSGKICEYTNFLSSPLTAGTITNLGTVNTISFAEQGVYVVRGGEKWALLTQKKDIVEGSALDFSSFSVDAPAGKYGPLKAVGNHFEFEGNPGVEQYFYGANLTTSAAAPDKARSDLVAARMTRIGYNTIRIHHYDAMWEENATDDAGDTFRDRMDYLIYNGIQRGLYFTLDLHSARTVKYSDVGFGEDDTVISASLYKFLSMVSASLLGDSGAQSAGHLAVFDNWKTFTDSVLDHENPYTGRKYSEEPALIMISVLNEPGYVSVWTKDVLELSLVQYAWVKCFGSSLASLYPPTSVSVGSSMWEKFVKWLQTNAYKNMSSYCREKGCASLMTVAYDSRCYIDKASGLSSLDVHDSHSYVDHHSGNIPEYTIEGKNPLEELPPYVNTSSDKYRDIYNKRTDVPHTLTEWNHCTPNPLRGLGAIFGSAFLRSRGWDAVWRFAYAQGVHNLFDTTVPNGFDVSKDEVMKASEAGVVSFFLRGDVTDPSSQVNYNANELSIITPRSEALYSSAMGLKTGSVLSVNTSIAPATILLTSMDGKELASSEKILLANITDCAGKNARYNDESKTVTMAFGSGQMIKISQTDIALALSSPSSYKVYELNVDGSREAEIPVTVRDGKLCFSVAIRGADGKAHLYYEITNE